VWLLVSESSKKLTPEEKKVKEAREKIIRENRKIKNHNALKLKKEKKAKRVAARKLKVANKRKSESFKPSAPLKKDASGKNIRVKKANKTPTVPHVSSVKVFRRERDSDRKAKLERRRQISKALKENRAAIKEAVAAGTKPPRKIKVKKILPTKATQKKQIKKKQEANKAKAAAQ